MIFGKILGGIFGAGGKVAGALSDRAQAKAKAEAFDARAGQAEKAADITERQTDIQLARQQRETFKGLGGIRASAGASGVKAGGSVLDILQSSASEAALDKSVIETQGQITAGGFTAEAEEARALAKGARSQAKGALIKGAFGAASSLLDIF